MTSHLRSAIPRIAWLAIAGASCVDVQESDATKAADSARLAGTAHVAPPVDTTEPRPDTVIAGSAARGAGSASANAPPDEPTLIRSMGSPAAQAALRTDTAHAFVAISEPPVPAPAPAGVVAGTMASPPLTSTPGDGDLSVLRAELIVPVQGISRAQLRDTYDEMRGGTRRHEALDIGAARGTPVLAAAPGRVLKLFSSKAGGLMVYAVDSTGHFIMMYGHLDAYQPGLADGQSLARGQQLGIVGTTGNAPPTVPHLHFAVARTSNPKQWWKGTPVNPYPLLK